MIASQNISVTYIQSLTSSQGNSAAFELPFPSQGIIITCSYTIGKPGKDSIFYKKSLFLDAPKISKGSFTQFSVAVTQSAILVIKNDDDFLQESGSSATTYRFSNIASFEVTYAKSQFPAVIYFNLGTFPDLFYTTSTFICLFFY